MEPMTTPRITAAADGSAAGNPGPGGWAWYINDTTWGAGGEPGTTNNRMEISAVLALLASTSGPITVLCDSRYVVDAATSWIRGWKRRGWRKADGGPVANRDLFEALDAAITGRDVVFEWVRGHDGHVLNEAADRRARAAAEAVRDGQVIVAGP
jgi:ribonuclease HI